MIIATLRTQGKAADGKATEQKLTFDAATAHLARA
jgi:hypothetical protein